MPSKSPSMAWGMVNGEEPMIISSPSALMAASQIVLHPDQTDAFSTSVGLSDNGWIVEIAAPAAVLGRDSFAEADSYGLQHRSG